ncbi:MAG TPA: tetratricopeptide repeat protein [Bryobacteraceae bacterium]|jgi:tetratricopeptide (TPR) repeat protein|nr:tetratricopeptide repeat protein [Bryobacteraceae bacterium]
MTTSVRNLAIALIAGTSLLVSTGCEKLKARDHLNKGVASFKNAKYPDAVEHFKQAIELDPSFPTARLYLATAYMSQYIPGADSPDNLQNAKAAHDNFVKVLEQEPNNTIAIASLASLHYSEAQGTQALDAKLQKLDEARQWYEKLAQVDPKNKEAYYSLGVITWAKWYPRLMEARAKLGMKPEDPGPIKDNKLRLELKEKYGPMIENGLQNLQKALEIDPQYDDAMAYMNLLIRERADLADTPDQYKKDIETADNWVQKALDTKKIKAEEVAKKGAGH